LISHASIASVRSLANILAGPFDHWHWSEDASPPVSFCVRALVLDGLAVPPFDRHADGDGRLRDLGLDAAIWRVAAVLEQRAILGEHARSLGTSEARGPLLERARAAAEVLRLPGSFCPGSEELRAQLNELFADYAPAGEAWKWRMSEASRLHGSGRQQRALWKALTPFHDRLATLSVFLVEYDEPVVMPLPPTTCLIAPDANPEGFGRQVVAAATALARA
jgi:hypothetical protein